MYSAGLPILLPIGFLDLLVGYWHDKYHLLRYHPKVKVKVEVVVGVVVVVVVASRRAVRSTRETDDAREAARPRRATPHAGTSRETDGKCGQVRGRERARGCDCGAARGRARRGVRRAPRDETAADRRPLTTRNTHGHDSQSSAVPP
jgi:hypothetical protein